MAERSYNMGEAGGSIPAPAYQSTPGSCPVHTGMRVYLLLGFARLSVAFFPSTGPARASFVVGSAMREAW